MLASLQARLEAFLVEQGAVAGTVHTVDDQVLHLAAAINIPPKVIAVTRLIPYGKGMAGRAFERREPIFTCDLAQPNPDIRPGARAVDATAAIALPILDAQGAVKAIVGLAYADDRDFEPAEIQRLRDGAGDLFV